MSKTFPDSSENVTYTYDNCPYGTGRLCGVEDESGTYSYAYDAHGNVVSMTKVELSHEYVTRYRYDNGDNLIGMTYPSGRAITINRDGVRRVESIGAEINGSDHTVANGITYRGDNRLLSCTIGNGLQESRSYDLQGRLVSQNTGAIDSRNYSYDANGNILSRTTTPQDSGYQYDALDRLIDDTIKGGTSDSYGYDLNGNRTSRVRNALEMTRYDYSPDSNRLNFVEKRFRGNNAVVPVQPSQTRTYNDANRWDQLFIEGALKATYIHNAMGQRTRKVVVNTDNTISTTVYHYDFQGMLISETNERGEPIKDYIWLDYAPIAQIEYDAIADSDTIYYLHTDHLMTPRFATDSGGNIVWRWEGEAFGDTLSKSDPDGNGKDVVVNLRFAGQYFDRETNLHYNYFRTYDPTTGRYTQSDPIGLFGGLNTYGYAESNPLYWIDPTGKIAINAGAAAVGAAIGAVSAGVTAAVSGGSVGQVAAAAAIGAAGGAVAGFTFGAAGSIAIGGAASSAIGSVAGQAVTGGTVDGGSVAMSAFAGVMGGGFGVLAGKAGYSTISQATVSAGTTAYGQGLMDFGQALNDRYPVRMCK